MIASITPEVSPDYRRPWLSGRGDRLSSRPTRRSELRRVSSSTCRSPLLSQQHDRRDRNDVPRADWSAASAPTVSCASASEGRAPLLVAILVAYTIPSVVLLVPLLVIFRTYGLINTFPGLILAEATNSAPFVLLLMINYFSTLPRELDDAAARRRLHPAAGAGQNRAAAVDSGPRGRRPVRLHRDLEQFPVRVPVHDDQRDQDAAGDHAPVRAGRARRVGSERRRRGADDPAGRADLSAVPAYADERACGRRGEGAESAMIKGALR